MIGDLGYVFRKEFGAQGWFTGTVVKIMKDGDRRCKYSDGDVEDLLLDDLVQLAQLDPNNYHNSTKEKKIPIDEKFQPDVKQSIATTNVVQVHRVKKSDPKQKRRKRKCSVAGCINQIQNGGVCVTHGAKVKRCSFKGCINRAIKGGVCITHGAMKNRCSSKGCTNQVQKGGVCITHGAMTKRCSFDGCNNHVVKGGVCVTHGAKKTRKVCSHTGCTSYAQKGGVCYRHRTKSININANNNPTIRPNAVTSAIPPHQPMNYEDDEEELNSWIWRSSRMGKMCCIK
jgi:hypothetical protein